MLKNLCYLSTAMHLLSKTELDELLAVARQKNEAAGITGLLLYCNGNFMQYVEGPAEAIDALWRTLGRDPRHHSIVEMFHQEIGERIFTGWSMALRTPDARQFDAFVQRARVAVEPGSTSEHPVVEMLRTFWQVNR